MTARPRHAPRTQGLAATAGSAASARTRVAPPDGLCAFDRAVAATGDKLYVIVARSLATSAVANHAATAGFASVAREVP